MDPDIFNGLAGLAALVNSLLMWPTIKSIKSMCESLKANDADHSKRLEELETKK